MQDEKPKLIFHTTPLNQETVRHTLHLPATLRYRIDQIAKHSGLKRSEVIRRLLEFALDHAELIDV